MDLSPYLTTDYAMYALLAIGALIILMLMIRMIGSKVMGKQGSRLGISEFREIDKSRRLVLVRRDDVEHLIMIGGPQDVVIEQRIGLDEATPAARPSTIRKPDFLGETRAQASASVTPLATRTPRPAVFGDRAPNLRPVEREEPKLDASDADSTADDSGKA